jgi:hypothetical protein
MTAGEAAVIGHRAVRRKDAAHRRRVCGRGIAYGAANWSDAARRAVGIPHHPFPGVTVRAIAVLATTVVLTVACSAAGCTPVVEGTATPAGADAPSEVVAEVDLSAVA